MSPKAAPDYEGLTGAAQKIARARLASTNEEAREIVGLPSGVSQTADLLRHQFGPGYTVEYEEEGGQPNGVGEIESNDERDWYSEGRENHHRHTFRIEGPWQAGPTEAVARRRAEDEARREASRRIAIRQAEEAAPAEALEDLAKGLYGADRLKQGFDILPKPWQKLAPEERDAYRERARDASTAPSWEAP